MISAMRGQLPGQLASVRVALGSALALAGLSVAYLLLRLSDSLLYIGPLDRAAFGWIVVMPIAWVTPAAAGLVWSRMRPRHWLIGAVIIGVPLVVLATFAIAIDVKQVGCTPVTSWTQVVPRALAVGAAFGAGWGGAAYVAAWAASISGSRWRYLAALAASTATAFVSFWLVIGVMVSVFPAVLCAPMNP